MNRTFGANRDLARWLVVALTLLAFGRSVWALGEKSLWWDESLSLHRAQQNLRTVLSNQIVLTDSVEDLVTIDDHPPLYFLALWLAVRVFGQTEFALRYLSLAFGLLIVPLLYVTARQLLGQQKMAPTAVAAAALGALSPMVLWFSQEARMYTMLACLSLLSFYLFVRAFVKPLDSPTVRVQGGWIGAYLLASTCLVLTHYLGSLVIAFEILALGLLLLRDLSNRRSLGVGIVALLGVLLLLLAYSLLNLPQLTSSTGTRFVPILELLRDLLNSFSLGLSVDVGHWYVWLIDLVFLFFLGLGLLRLVGPGATGRSRRAGWLLAGYLLFPITIAYVQSFVRPVYMTSRHLILASPPFFLLVAAGLTTGIRRLRSTNRRIVTPVTLVGWLVVVGGIGHSTWNYFQDPTYGKDDYRQWGAYLREHARPGDVVVIEPAHVADLYAYYADPGVPWIGLPLLNASPQDALSTLEGLFEQYDRVWLAYSSTPSWGDPNRLPIAWLREHAYQADHRRFRGYGSELMVAGYLPGWPSVQRLPQDAVPVEIRYSSALRLEGYRLVTTPQAGDRLHVELFWAVDEPIPEEASVLLRVVDNEGHLWGESEQCPFNALYPMWQWQPGLLLRDERDLPIWPGTPPGTYHLELVLLAQGETCPGDESRPLPPITASNRRGNGVLLGGDVLVWRAQTPPRLADLGIPRRQGQRFDGLELLGSGLTAHQLRPGEYLDVSLYWEAYQAPLPDHLFRLRLTDSAGTVWHEATVRPVGDGYPTSLWQAGDRFRGTFRLWVPEDAAKGRYRLELVPEPPLQQRGLWARLRRVLHLGGPGVHLGSLDVIETQRVVPATPPPPPADLPASHSMLATLGDQVRFLGYDLSADVVQAGQPLTVTLYWQALQPMELSYTVFLHLLGPSNEIFGQKDGLPQDGTYATSSWQPGEVVVDQRTFTVDPGAPPVTHTLEVGMYRLETLTRLPVLDASGQPVPDDRILLSQVGVLPTESHVPAHLDLPFRIFLPLVESGP
jgi:mannosyltransferase